MIVLHKRQQGVGACPRFMACPSSPCRARRWCSKRRRWRNR